MRAAENAGQEVKVGCDEKKAKKYVFWGCGIFVLYLCIYYWKIASGILWAFFSAAVPLISGLAIAYALNILTGFFERHYFTGSKKKFIEKSRRGICMLMAVACILLAATLVIFMVVPQVLDCLAMFAEKLPAAVEGLLMAAYDAGLLTEETVSVAASTDWQACISEAVGMLISGMVGIMEKGSSFFSSMVNVFLSIVFALYLVSGKDKLGGQCRRIMAAYLSREKYSRISHVLTVLDNCFHKFVVGQCVEAVILGVLCGVGMWIFRFPYALMIGALVGVTALIPVLGAYIGAVVGVVMMLTVSPMKALLFLVYIVVLQQLEGNLIYPRMVGSSIGLPGIWVLAAVTIGGGVMGIPGMLAGVPLAATAYCLLWKRVNEKEKEKR